MKLKIEEIFTLMKEMNRGQKEKDEEKPTNNSSHSKAREVFSIHGVGKDEERFLTNQLSDKEKRYMSCLK